MGKTNSVSENTDIQSTSFELVLPTEIDVKPTWVVPLSKTRDAHIFQRAEETQESRNYGYAYTVTKNETVYDLVVVIRKTGRSVTDGYYGRSTTYHHLHNLKQALVDLSAQMNVKKKVKKTLEVEEADDE